MSIILVLWGSDEIINIFLIACVIIAVLFNLHAKPELRSTISCHQYNGSCSNPNISAIGILDYENLGGNVRGSRH